MPGRHIASFCSVLGRFEFGSGNGSSNHRDGGGQLFVGWVSVNYRKFG
jgi:hypothetical protein